MADDDTRLKFLHGLPEVHTTEDIEEYALFRIKVYSEESWRTARLSMYYFEDFSNFTVEMFSKIGHDTRRKLRDILRARGVYVPYGRGILTKVALHEAMKEELQWPENEHSPHTNKTQNTSTREPDHSAQLEKSIVQRNDVATNDSIRFSTISDPTLNAAIDTIPKSYTTDKNKYNGSTGDNFDMKLAIFRERCDQANPPEESRHKAFSAMLSDAALHYYLTT